MRLGRQKAQLEGDQLVGVGRRITEARLEAGMTKMELAEKLGVPLGLFEHYEAGGEDPSPHLNRLAQVTGKPVTWFGGESPDDAVAGATKDEEPGVVEPDEEPLLVGEPEDDEPAAAAADEAPAEPDEATVEPLVIGDAELEPQPEEQPAPVAETEPEPTAAATPELSTIASSAIGGGVTNGDEDDDLDRLLTSLSRQREQMAARRGELDERERAVTERESDLERREQELSDRALSLDDRETALNDRESAVGEQESSRAAEIDADWQEKLQSFEDTNRQYAQAAAALADWAAELRGSGGGAQAAEGEGRKAEPESEPLRTSPSSGDDFPEDF